MNDLTGNLITTFSRANNCICQFSANAAINPNFGNYAANLKFDSTVIDGSQVIDVKKVYAGCLVGAQMPLLIAEEGQPLPTSSSLRVDKVQFVNLVPTGGALNEWQGQWSISFQVGAGSAIRSVRPILVSQKVTVDASDPPNTRITSCSGMSSGSGTLNFLAKWSPVSGVLEDTTVFEHAATRNIGKGTQNPVSSLEVQYTNGAAFPRGITSTLVNSIADAALFITRKARGAPGGGEQAVQTGDRLGNLLSMGYDGGGWIHSTQIISEVDGIVGAGSIPTALSFQTGTSAGGEERLRIGSDRSFGIQTSYWNTDTGITTHSGGMTILNRTAAVDGRLSGLIFRMDDGQVGRASRTGIFAVGNAANGLTDLVFAPSFNGAAGNPTERMRVTSGGPVGIGTSAPLHPLHVAQPFPMTDANRRVVAGFTSNEAANPLEMSLQISGGALAARYAAIQVSEFGALPAQPHSLILQPDGGLVGIGTTNPQARLEVTGPIRSNSIAGWSGLDMYLNGGNRSTVYNDSNFPGSLAFDTPGGPDTQKMIIRSNGYVGIGTSNPDWNLEVEMNRPGEYVGIANTNLAAGGLRWSWLSSSTGTSLGANAMCFETGGVCVFTLDSAGNVAISGVYSPSDERLKKDITPILNALDSIGKLEGVFFRWLDSSKPKGKQQGLIAQNVETIFPELVTTNQQGIKSVNYIGLIAPIINAINELKTWLSMEGEKVKNLEIENDLLKQRISNLEQEQKVQKYRQAKTDELVAKLIDRVNQVEATSKK